ncbi:MAG: ABC-F family ATP-binding cassette domain-containing protein, partial [Pyrinomonadaceae bacterium]|nr:ABC-F family ATP-binding cassette domain-containing protein [Pyrinomonadaceae bacterium]
VLSLENVSKNYGIRPLFEGVTLGLEAGERIGIIGANGSGKTTLLRVVAGQEPPDTGRVALAEGRVLSFLPQNPLVDEGATVLETIFDASGGVMKLIRDYEAACHELAVVGGTNRRLLDAVAELQHKLESSGGWELETNARVVLTKLGIDDTAARMGALSGGQRKRVALAHALIVRPDVLILDEPTNHLDADTVQWLESYLARYTGTLLLVTHDRYFLDRVTTRILEIDRGAVQSFDGSYAYYLEKKEEQEAQRAVEGQKRKMLIRRELAWLRRGAKARTRKSKTRVDAAHALMAQPVETAKAGLDIAIGARRLGTKVVELHEVSKSYDGRPLLDQFTYLLKRDDRIGMIGPNGAGKTTLLEIITGRVRPDAGEVEIGQTVAIGYYDQESRALNDEQRVIDYIREVAEQVETKDGTRITAGQMLEKFLFLPAAQYAVIGKLSGGERRRLYLLRVLMSAPNVLLLDEPTNDLDIPTLMALEAYLDDFAGALVVVSHDRYFLDRTIEHVFKFEGDGRVREYPGDYSAYLEFREREETAQSAETRAADAVQSPPAARKESAKPRKLSFKEKRELETLEKIIATAEVRKIEIEAELNAHASDAGKVQALFTEQQLLLRQLERDMERWAELAELAEV